MKYLTRMLALTRLMQLKRQWKRIAAWLALLTQEDQQVLAALVYGEAQRAGKHPLPQFYASQNIEAYSPWGDAVQLAFARICNEGGQSQMRGVATWLAVVYHETGNTQLAALRSLHNDVAYELNKYRSLHERVLAIRMAA